MAQDQIFGADERGGDQGGPVTTTERGTKRDLDVTDKQVIDKLNAGLDLNITDSETTRTIYNVSLGIVDTEQSQTLPATTKGFLIRTRAKAELKLSFSVGTSGTNYITIPRNSSYDDQFFTTALTLYFQSPQTGDIVEIVAYS